MLPASYWITAESHNLFVPFLVMLFDLRYSPAHSIFKVFVLFCFEISICRVILWDWLTILCPKNLSLMDSIVRRWFVPNDVFSLYYHYTFLGWRCLLPKEVPTSVSIVGWMIQYNQNNLFIEHGSSFCWSKLYVLFAACVIAFLKKGHYILCWNIAYLQKNTQITSTQLNEVPQNDTAILSSLFFREPQIVPHLASRILWC